MASFTFSVTSPLSFADTVTAIREELGVSGFGVLTEIDVQATLAAKLGEEVAPLLILGACKPQFAHRVLMADPSIAALLPCNVVVRQDENVVVVEAFDPAVMATIAGSEMADEVQAVAADARADLRGALDRVAARPGAQSAVR